MTPEHEPAGILSTEELLRRHSRAQDPALLEEIVRRFEPLARSVARRYASRGEPLEDLTQSEIASRIGTSQMQVSRLLRAAIEKIRKVSGELGEPPSR